MTAKLALKRLLKHLVINGALELDHRTNGQGNNTSRPPAPRGVYGAVSRSTTSAA